MHFLSRPPVTRAVRPGLPQPLCIAHATPDASDQAPSVDDVSRLPCPSSGQTPAAQFTGYDVAYLPQVLCNRSQPLCHCGFHRIHDKWLKGNDGIIVDYRARHGGRLPCIPALQRVGAASQTSENTYRRARPIRRRVALLRGARWSPAWPQRAARRRHGDQILDRDFDSVAPPVPDARTGSALACRPAPVVARRGAAAPMACRVWQPAMKDSRRAPREKWCGVIVLAPPCGIPIALSPGPSAVNPIGITTYSVRPGCNPVSHAP
jgi:hypothetical protein